MKVRVVTSKNNVVQNIREMDDSPPYRNNMYKSDGSMTIALQQMLQYAIEDAVDNDVVITTTI